MRNHGLVLCRAADGGWSLHAPGSTDEAIREGDSIILLSGEAEWDGTLGRWSRPTRDDYEEAWMHLLGIDERGRR